MPAVPEVHAEDGDTIDGALWRFEMTSMKRKGEVRGGRFRVADHVLYQKDGPRSEGDEHVVGKDLPKGKRRTVIEFDGLRTFKPGPPREVAGPISGKVRLSSEKRGRWYGELIDGDGVRWKFHCVRIQE
jgi:hypothetical protein